MLSCMQELLRAFEVDVANVASTFCLVYSLLCVNALPSAPSCVMSTVFRHVPNLIITLIVSLLICNVTDAAQILVM